MGISEIVSPVTRKGSKVGSDQPMSPGARSAPSSRDRSDSVPNQPSHAASRISKNSDEPAELKITGPED